MSPENTPQEIVPAEEQTSAQQETIDAAWLLSRITAILYFIDFQYGNEATTVIEQVAGQIENSIRAEAGSDQ